MTAREMFCAIGTTVLVRFEELEVLCTVQDVKTAYGRPRLQIKPLAGAGEQWVELGRVTMIPAGNPFHSRTLDLPEGY